MTRVYRLPSHMWVGRWTLPVPALPSQCTIGISGPMRRILTIPLLSRNARLSQRLCRSPLPQPVIHRKKSLPKKDVPGNACQGCCLSPEADGEEEDRKENSLLPARSPGKSTVFSRSLQAPPESFAHPRTGECFSLPSLSPSPSLLERTSIILLPGLCTVLSHSLNPIQEGSYHDRKVHVVRTRSDYRFS